VTKANKALQLNAVNSTPTWRPAGRSELCYTLRGQAGSEYTWYLLTGRQIPGR